jgi:membrane-associated phospholipid phosphatase
MQGFLKKLFEIIALSFRGKNLLIHIVAYILTAIIVLSGFDWYYFVHFRDLGFSLLFSAVILGGLVPIILPIYLLITARIFKDIKRYTLGIALVLSALAGLIISSFYKIFTGRIQPNQLNIVTDISRQFNFGILRHGMFWGWPSSHSTVAFAMAFTLITLFPKNKMLKILAFIYALYIGIGVSMSIHWFSEFVAGALIGALIGITTGKLFKLSSQGGEEYI